MLNILCGRDYMKYEEIKSLRIYPAIALCAKSTVVYFSLSILFSGKYFHEKIRPHRTEVE